MASRPPASASGWGHRARTWAQRWPPSTPARSAAPTGSRASPLPPSTSCTTPTSTPRAGPTSQRCCVAPSCTTRAKTPPRAAAAATASTMRPPGSGATTRRCAPTGTPCGAAATSCRPQRSTWPMCARLLPPATCRPSSPCAKPPPSPPASRCRAIAAASSSAARTIRGPAWVRFWRPWPGAAAGPAAPGACGPASRPHPASRLRPAGWPSAWAPTAWAMDRPWCA